MCGRKEERETDSASEGEEVDSDERYLKEQVRGHRKDQKSSSERKRETCRTVK